MWKKKKQKKDKKINWLKGERQLEKTQKEKRQKGYKKKQRKTFSLSMHTTKMFFSSKWITCILPLSGFKASQSRARSRISTP